MTGSDFVAAAVTRDDRGRRIESSLLQEIVENEGSIFEREIAPHLCCIRRSCRGKEAGSVAEEGLQCRLHSLFGFVVAVAAGD